MKLTEVVTKLMSKLKEVPHGHNHFLAVEMGGQRSTNRINKIFAACKSCLKDILSMYQHRSV